MTNVDNSCMKLDLIFLHKNVHENNRLAYYDFTNLKSRTLLKWVVVEWRLKYTSQWYIGVIPLFGHIRDIETGS